MHASTAADIAAALKPGQRVFVAGSSNEPTSLLNALMADDVAAHLPQGLQFVQFPISGYNTCDFTRFGSTAQLTTFFMTPELRRADVARVHFLPMQMRYVFDYLRHNVDVVLLQVQRDAGGVLRSGPNADFLESALEGARLVVAELNTASVAPAGAPAIEEAGLDFLFASHREPFVAPVPEIDDAATEIGRRVAELIHDGDCLQTGIGAIPAAILGHLRNHSDLGLHGGLIDDGGMSLIKNRNVNGARKTIDRGQHVTGMLLGSAELYQWAAQRPDVVLRGANYTHEVSVIRQIDRFVSVNSAVQIDLHGQVNAEVVGGRQISGTGGSVDFMRAAKMSDHGRSIVAMNATARRGTVSRIVANVEMVTALRTDVDLVVTEFGVADLRHLPARQRAQALIAVAAPDFRAELEAATGG